MTLNLFVTVVLLGVVLVVVSEPLGRCPEDDNGYSVLLPDSDDSTKFYKCEEGKLKSTKCQLQNGEYVDFLPHESDCSKFYKCDWGELKLFNCSDGLHFNPSLNVCDWPEQAGCKDGSSSTGKPTTSPQSPTTPTSTTEGNGNNACLPLNGEYVYFIPHESDCTKFYKCDWGVLQLFNCSDGLHFNPSLNVCDWPEQAGCKDDPSSTGKPSSPPQSPTTPTSTTDDNVSGTCPPLNGEYVYFIPHDSDCTRFYKCDWGVLQLFNCSDGLHFNPSLNVCDFPEQAGCKDDTSTTKKPTTPPQSPTTPTDDQTCPPLNGEYVYFIPHDSDCTRFYKCDWGVLQLFNCSDGLHFNPSLNVCDFPEQAGCKDDTSTTKKPTTPPQSPTTPTDDQTCPPLNGEYVYFIPHDSDCTRFYKCDWGVLQLFNCSDGLHFNPSLNVCDFPEQAGCKDDTFTTKKPTTPPQSPTTPTDDQTCPPLNGEYVYFIPHDSDCTRFYKCDWGVLQLFNCSDGLHFNPSLNVCDFPEQAGCKDDTSTTKKPTTPPQSPTTPTDDQTCPPLNGEYVYFIPHDSDCTRFYKCDWGVLQLFNCSDGLHFNPSLNVCDFPEQAGCKDDTSTTKKPTTPPQSPTTPTDDQTCPPLNGEYVYFIPHDSDCTRFYKCDWGVLQLFNCSDGLHFNPSLNVCDFPEQAGCKDDTSTTKKPTTPPQSPTTPTDDQTCPPLNGEYVYFIPHDSDCTKFYKCDWGVLQLFNCSDGLHFNPSLNVCDFPEQAGCKDDTSTTKKPTTPPQSPTTPTDDQTCPPLNGEYVYFIPHDSDCTRFYKCDWGVLQLFNCSDGLHFNPSLNVCDFPEQAGCKDDTSTTKKPTTPPQSPTTPTDDQTCPPLNGEYVYFIPHDSDCTRFYKCDWGVLQLFNCSDGLHFNPSLNVCDFPEQAGCKDDTSTTKKPTTPPQSPTTPTDDQTCPPLNGEYVYFIPHDSDCTRFYKCDWCVLQLFNCSDGLHFNPSLNVCDFPEQAGCKDDTSTTKKPTTPPQSPTTPTDDQTCPPLNGEYVYFIPHNSDCTKFYKCDWGVLQLFNCSDGLHFNPSLNVCDFPEQAGCKDDTSTTKKPTTPPQSPTTPTDDQTCPPLNGEYVYFIPHDSDCTRFYKCDWGVLQLFNCSDGLHFNPSLNVCDFPEQAGCKDDTSTTKKPTTPPQSPTTPTDDQTCPPLNGEYVYFIPHDSDCTRFYKCDWGVLQLFNCSDGLHFNPSLNVCDFPEQAGCKDDTSTTKKPTTPPQSPTTPTDDQTCPPLNGEYVYFIPHDSDCTRFYKCDWGVLQLFNCSDGLHFNPSLNVCDFPEQAGCKDDTSTTKKPTTPPQSPTTPTDDQTCPPLNGEYVYFIPHDSDCTRFYKCDWGVLQLFNCSDGLHFNPSLNVCDFPEQAGCKDDTSTTKKPTTPPQSPTTPTDDQTCPPLNGEYVYFIPHDSDCTKFYKCDWGVLKPFNCTGGLHFNPNLDVCDWPEQAGCIHGIPTL